VLAQALAPTVTVDGMATLVVPADAERSRAGGRGPVKDGAPAVSNDGSLHEQCTDMRKARG